MLDLCKNPTGSVSILMLNTMLRLIPSLWANLLPTKTKSLLQCNELLLRPRGSHLHAAYSSVCDQVFDRQSVLNHFIVTFWGSWALDFQRVKGQIATVCSWSIDFSSSEVTWISPQKGFDRLIQFWSRLQMLLHETYKWLPLVRLRSQLHRISHICGVAPFPDSQCIIDLMQAYWWSLEWVML